MDGNYNKIKNAVNDWYEYRGIGYTRAQHHPDRVKACTEYNNFSSTDVLIQTFPRSGKFSPSPPLSLSLSVTDGAAYLECSMYCYVTATKTAVEVNENEKLDSNV